jgi:Peptidase family M23
VKREKSGWVTPAESGIVRATSKSLVEIDHGNGFRTGYYHLRSDTIQVQNDQKVGVTDKLGRPSCEAERGGEARGTHVHFYICEQADPNQVCGPNATSSAVRPIDGLVIGGWTIHATADKNYDGTMTKPKEDARTADARVCDPGNCDKIRNDLTR